MENSNLEPNKARLEIFPLSKSVPFLLKWFGTIGFISFSVGSASAFFLVSLEKLSRFRELNPWLVYFLPFAGFAIGWFYFHYGKNVSKGNNLLLEEIHSPSSIIPIRMAPFVFLGTLITHLFGGSAGREGTAVQMGGSIAHQLVRVLPFTIREQQTLIILGISAGFASVFGTPFAAAIFSVEVIRIGNYRWRYIFLSLVTAYLAHLVCLLWGVDHSNYPKIPFDFNGTIIVCLVILGILSGWVAKLFSWVLQNISNVFQYWIQYSPVRPLVGGIVIVLFVVLGLSPVYLGLGLSTLQSAFVNQLPPETFLLKLIVTTITIGSGFKGGEVTPLFFIGAGLGNLFGYIDPSHLVLFVGIGFISVFAGATNTPLACAVMGMELFGWESGIYFFLTAGIAYIASGHTSIYQSQIVGKTKLFSKSSDLGKRISDLKK
ncbi:chloride channel protein [Leptospira congkakensis]|uniref:Chloride channel protein n=1 Tax=Leptospira congkakensis TaxID=2484932 RepID=A0A4Z1A5F5_9LEPT|nr:chloride channel protein [Leptospira congkakensis]TGL87223.1 chloride channel protein [Leptospira congkakensis]TGL96790.1 chloride channel protein [Leptospira congkakensis]TGL97640.1 chloride channel protein [Leptospira congkakensis]